MYQLSAIDEVDGAFALILQVALERVSRRVLLRRVRSFWRLAIVLCSADCKATKDAALKPRETEVSLHPLTATEVTELPPKCVCIIALGVSNIVRQ